MKIILEQLVASREALDELGALKDLPFATSFKCGRLLKAASAELMQYDQARGKSLSELGATPNPKTNHYDFPTPEAFEEFRKQHAEVMATEVEFPVEPLKLEQFGNATLSPRSSMLLDWLIVE